MSPTMWARPNAPRDPTGRVELLLAEVIVCCSSYYVLSFLRNNLYDRDSRLAVGTTWWEDQFPISHEYRTVTVMLYNFTDGHNVQY